METILVTGGAGFIGGAFTRATIASEEVRVVNLDLLTYSGNLGSLASVIDSPKHIFVKGDIADRKLLRDLLGDHKPRAIVHFAAESHVDRSIDDPRKFAGTNVTGTLELLIAAVNYMRTLPPGERDEFRFLQVSTDEVYGPSPPEGGVTEASRFAPTSPYSASKASADHFAHAFFCTYGLPVVCTHCSNNYGPYQVPEKLIPLMIQNAIEGKSLPVYGDGGHVRDWLFVEDHVRALRLVLGAGRPGETYNIGSGDERTNLEVVREVCKTVDALAPLLPTRPTQKLIALTSDRPGHDRRYSLDCTKIRTQLGWAPEVPFEEGIRATVKWYLEHPDYLSKHRERVGLGERLENDDEP